MLYTKVSYLMWLIIIIIIIIMGIYVACLKTSNYKVLHNIDKNTLRTEYIAYILKYTITNKCK